MTIPDAISQGSMFPYDASDEWNEQIDPPGPPPAVDWAHTAARAVIADLTDRRKIKNGFDDIDESVRVEIVRSLAEIIRASYHQSVSNSAP